MSTDSVAQATPKKPDPTLTRTRVIVAYTSSDKYRAELTCKAGVGSKNLRTGEEVPPERALLAGLEELARLTALFGFQDEALEAFNGARQRVADWRASCTPSGAQPVENPPV